MEHHPRRFSTRRPSRLNLGSDEALDAFPRSTLSPHPNTPTLNLLFSDQSSSEQAAQEVLSEHTSIPICTRPKHMRDGAESIPGEGRNVKYADFSTIDWQADFAKERIRLKRLRESGSWLANIFDASQAWLAVAFVGVATGFITVFIALVDEWLSDLKFGYCKSSWYLNRKFCCWGEDEDECNEWALWGQQLTGSNARDPDAHPQSFAAGYFAFVFFATSFAVISAYLVKNLAPYAAGSGIPEVKTILSGFVMRKFLGGWTLLVKTICLPLSTASGMMLGKEGPLVHVACCVGNIFPRLFPKFANNEAKKREILSAAAAAGVACAFGAPIGGVLFSLEEVSYYFPYKTMLRAFFSAMMAAVTLQVLNPYRTGKLVLFQVTYERIWHSFELIFFILLGVIGGLMGALFLRCNLNISLLRKKPWLRSRPVQDVCAIAMLNGLVAYLNIYMRASNDKLVGALFRECPGVNPTDPYISADELQRPLCDPNAYGHTGVLLLVAYLGKIALTIVTFGIKVPCGIFIPSLVCGGCIGRVLGILIDYWHRSNSSFILFAACPLESACINVGQYALLGGAAMLAGVTRMTVSLVVIMFEITGALNLVLPIMITVMVAKFTADYFGHASIYDGLIRLNRYPFLDPKEEYIQDVHAGEIMTTSDDLVVILATGSTIQSLEQLLQEHDYQGFPVVISVKSMQLVGYINREELKYALGRARRQPSNHDETSCVFTADAAGLVHDAVDLDESRRLMNQYAVPSNVLPVNPRTSQVDLSSWVDQTPISIMPQHPMEMTIDLFKKMGLRHVPIVKNAKLLGLITKKDVLRHLGRLKGSQQLDQSLLINRLVG